MNWGKGIVLSFVLFATFVIVLVVICFRQTVSLVSADYYQKELRFQEQIDRMNNTASLLALPSVKISNGNLTVDFQSPVPIERGELQLFRPSDANLDRKFSISESVENIRLFDVSGMPRGIYKVRMNWSAAGKGYYFEKTIQL